MRTGGGGDDGLPAEQEEEGVNRRQLGPDPLGSMPRQRVPLPVPTRRQTRTQLSEESYTDSGSDYGAWPPTRRQTRTQLSEDSYTDSGSDYGAWPPTQRKAGIANAFGTGSGEEAAVDSSPSPAVLVRATNRTGPFESQEGKRRRGTPTTSSPHHLDVGEGSDAAVEKDTDSSSGYSSPVRRPRSLLVEQTNSSGDVEHVYNSDPEAVDAYHRDFQKYQKKLARLQELPTLKQCKLSQNIFDWHDIKTKNAVLDVAESVLSISSVLDGKEISRCSGVIIEWIEVNRSAIVVTSTQIICSKISYNDWEDNNVYAPNAKI